MKTKSLALIIPAAASSLMTGCSSNEKPAEKPNVIFIMMDDAGYGDFGCYGQQKIQTPNVDALAARGIRFTDMYSAAPLSAPSRCCLMTGQHMGHAQIRSNCYRIMGDRELNHPYMDLYLDPLLEGQRGLIPGTPTLASVMREGGYKTAMIGKWGLGGPESGSMPLDMGFDYYYGCVCQYVAHWYYPKHVYENNERLDVENDFIPKNMPLPEGADPRDPAAYAQYASKNYLPDMMFEKIIDYVTENKDNPFFLMWTTPIPHSPLQAHEEDVRKYVEIFGDEDPIKGEKYIPCRYPHATYAAMVTYIDRQLGLLVDKLKELGIYDNTIIIFTSDNGPACNSCSQTTWFESAAPFSSVPQWGKSSLHEGGIRMPFVFAWGDRIKKPYASDHIGFFPDMMPTLADIAGVECPPTDGISLLPTFLGKPSKQKEHEYLYFEFPIKKGWVNIRYDKWKGLLQNAKKDTHIELYDINNDPMETNDLSAEHPEVIAKMWEFIRESHTPGLYKDANMKIKGLENK